MDGVLSHLISDQICGRHLFPFTINSCLVESLCACLDTLLAVNLCDRVNLMVLGPN